MKDWLPSSLFVLPGSWLLLSADFYDIKKDGFFPKNVYLQCSYFVYILRSHEREKIQRWWHWNGKTIVSFVAQKSSIVLKNANCELVKMKAANIKLQSKTYVFSCELCVIIQKRSHDWKHLCFCLVWSVSQAPGSMGYLQPHSTLAFSVITRHRTDSGKLRMTTHLSKSL